MASTLAAMLMTKDWMGPHLEDEGGRERQEPESDSVMEISDQSCLQISSTKKEICFFKPLSFGVFQ